MFVYTLVMLILPPQGGLEYSIQHFNSPEECREAALVIGRAWAQEFDEALIIPNCVQGLRT